MHIIDNGQMTENHRRTTEGAIFPNLCAASDANTSSHRCILTDMAIMTNLDLIIQNDSIFNDCVGKCSAINTCVRTDNSTRVNNALRTNNAMVVDTNVAMQ